MPQNTNIAIVTGGYSSENVISLRSARQVLSILERTRYRCRIVEVSRNGWQVLPGEGPPIPIDRNNFSFREEGREISFDFAFLALHGPPGEDGTLQAYFELLGIPYSSPGVLSLALSFNKYICNSYLSGFGIPTGKSLLLEKGRPVDARKVVSAVGLPCFVKPNRGGSSFGVSRVKDVTQLAGALELAWKEDEQALVEEYLPGREFTCGLIKGGGKELVFPLTEVVSRNQFFDYEAKYTSGFADEITPAPISGRVSDQCRKLASRIYDLMECRGIVRIDFIYSARRFNFLELNGVPGLSPESIVPQQIRASGKSEREVYSMIIEEGLKAPGG